MRQLFLVLLGLGIGLGSGAAMAQPKSMPEDAKVYILWPPDGQVIRGAFWVRMGMDIGG